MADKSWKVKLIGDSSNAESAMDRLHHKASTLGNLMKVGLAAAAAATAGLAVEIKKAADAAGNAQKAEVMFAEAMKQHGTYTAASYDELTKFAGAQTAVTAYTRTATIEAMRQLQMFGMDTETMKKATQAAQDLARAKGMDLSTAATLVGKAFAGNTATMGRYGIVLDQTRLQAEGFDYVLGELNAKFGGQAAAYADTYQGKMEKLKASFAAFQVTIGKAVIPGLGAMADALSSALSETRTSEAFQGMAKGLGDAVGRMAPILINGITGLLEVFTKSDIFPQILNMITSIGNTLMPLLDSLIPPLTRVAEAMMGAFADALDAAVPLIEAIAPILATIIEKVASFLERSSPILSKIMDAIAQVLLKTLERLEPYLNRILDALLKALEQLLPMLPGVVDMFGKLLSVAITLATPILNLASNANVLKGVLIALIALKVANFFTGIASSITGITASLGPMGIAAAATVGSVFALYSWAENMKTTAQKLAQEFGNIEKGWDAMSAAERRATIADLENRMATTDNASEKAKLQHEIDVLSKGLTGTVDEYEKIQQAMSDTEAAAQQGVTAMHGMTPALQDLGKQLAAQGGEVPAQIRNALSSASESTRFAGQEMLKGWVSGFVEQWQASGVDVQGLSADMANMLSTTDLSTDAGKETLNAWLSGLSSQYNLSSEQVAEIGRLLTLDMTKYTAGLGGLAGKDMVFNFYDGASTAYNDKRITTGLNEAGQNWAKTHVQGMLSMEGLAGDAADSIMQKFTTGMADQNPEVRNQAAISIREMAASMVANGQLSYTSAEQIGNQCAYYLGATGTNAGTTFMNNVQAAFNSAPPLQVQASLNFTSSFLQSVGPALGIPPEVLALLSQHEGGAIYHAGGAIRAEIAHMGRSIRANERIVLAEVDEYMINRRSAGAIGRGNLDYMNRTGRIPPTGGGGIQVNINVENMYGEREYVRMLAREITKEMPNVEFGRWSRV